MSPSTSSLFSEAELLEHIAAVKAALLRGASGHAGYRVVKFRAVHLRLVPFLARFILRLSSSGALGGKSGVSGRMKPCAQKRISLLGADMNSPTSGRGMTVHSWGCPLPLL